MEYFFYQCNCIFEKRVQLTPSQVIAINLRKNYAHKKIGRFIILHTLTYIVSDKTNFDNNIFIYKFDKSQFQKIVTSGK